MRRESPIGLVACVTFDRNRLKEREALRGAPHFGDRSGAADEGPRGWCKAPAPFVQEGARLPVGRAAIFPAGVRRLDRRFQLKTPDRAGLGCDREVLLGLFDHRVGPERYIL